MGIGILRDISVEFTQGRSLLLTLCSGLIKFAYDQNFGASAYSCSTLFFFPVLILVLLTPANRRNNFEDEQNEKKDNDTENLAFRDISLSIRVARKSV